MIAPLQSEFQLPVSVCAWCKPKNRRLDLGTSLGSISHGICPRHVKKLMLDLERMKGDGHPARATSSRRRRAVFDHPELNYEA